jgi:hypothetical protein
LPRSNREAPLLKILSRESNFNSSMNSFDCAVLGRRFTRRPFNDGRRLLEHRGSARCEQLGGFYRAKEEFN